MCWSRCTAQPEHPSSNWRPARSVNSASSVRSHNDSTRDVPGSHRTANLRTPASNSSRPARNSVAREPLRAADDGERPISTTGHCLPTLVNHTLRGTCRLLSFSINDELKEIEHERVIPLQTPVRPRQNRAVFGTSTRRTAPYEHATPTPTSAVGDSCICPSRLRGQCRRADALRSGSTTLRQGTGSGPPE